MHRAGEDGALRHLDYAFLDVVSMQISLLLMYWLMGNRGFPYADAHYRTQMAVFFVAQMALGLFSDAYNGILRRTTREQLTALLLYVAEVWLLGGVFLLLSGIQASVPEMLIATVFFFVIAFFVRKANTLRHIRRGGIERKLLLVTSNDQMHTVLSRLQERNSDSRYEVIGILLTDRPGDDVFYEQDIPVFSIENEAALEDISRWWIDDVLFFGSEKTQYPTALMETFLVMGITIHYSLAELESFSFARTGVQELGGYKVISNSIRFVSDRGMLMKRLLDILGGLAGTILTGIIFLFVAPAITINSPGPIFFRQKRVGQNGQFFYIYKFRSMYMDAEKRKAELMEKNKLQNGLMFKMDDDPRIIGSEKKGKDGKPKGIGNFIRNTSLDEFPQFLNVLKGEMSLVGTRPPTIDEWKQYDFHHRARMSVKPGITGMWQISGRSSITDFEQVVDLDRWYIENWTFLLDLKILLKTVKVVLKREDAS